MISLPPGEEYRDLETRTASERVSAFAVQFQPRIDLAAELNKLGEMKRSGARIRRKPVFISRLGPQNVRRMSADHFYYSDTRDLQPEPENIKRILLDWGRGSNSSCVTRRRKHKVKTVSKISKYRKNKRKTSKNKRKFPSMKQQGRNRRPAKEEILRRQLWYKMNGGYSEKPLAEYGRVK